MMNSIASSQASSVRMPVFFISHGGGPWPYMKDYYGDKYDKLEASFQALPGMLPAHPQAILMISAHWEEADFAIMASPQPPMLYDYGGFPEHTYRVKYSAPGSPALAQRVKNLLDAAGLRNHLDAQRGFDHGTFTPMAVIAPQADIPIVQVSLQERFDPALHVALGRALAPLRDEGVLIIGSGSSFHNRRPLGAAASPVSQVFDQWLRKTMLDSTPEQRVQALSDWAQAPEGRRAHAREEHLIPLMVAVGAAEQDLATCVYHEGDFDGGVAVSSFKLG